MPNLLVTEQGTFIAGTMAHDDHHVDVIQGNVQHVPVNIDADNLVTQLVMDQGLETVTAAVLGTVRAEAAEQLTLLRGESDLLTTSLSNAFAAADAVVKDEFVAADVVVISSIQEEVEEEDTRLQGEIDAFKGVVLPALTSNSAILQNSAEGNLTAPKVVTDSLSGGTGYSLMAQNLRVEEGPEAEVPADGLPRGLVFTTGYTSEKLQLFDDARVVMVPDANSLYSFGAVDGETGADRANYDGIDMYTGIKFEAESPHAQLPNADQDELNRFQLRVNKVGPTLDIRHCKTDPATPIIGIRDEFDVGTLILNAQGELETRCTVSTLEAFNIIGKREVDEENTDVFTVTGNGQVHSGNVRIDGTVNDNEVPLLEVVKHTGNSKFRVKPNGQTTIWSTGQTNFEILDAANQNAPHLRVMNTGQLKLWANNPTGGHLMECRNSQDELVFYIRESGSIQFRHNLTGSGVAHMASSTVAGSQSLYVGSARLSYSHTEHRMLLHQLKPDHIPVYLQGRGFTVNDLPDAHVQNDMSVFKWIVHARDHFGEEDLDVHDVFPSANDDWIQADAPVDGVIADVQALQSAHVGIDADITTLETEMDAAEVRLDALEGAGGGAPLATFLSQQSDSTASSFVGTWNNSGNLVEKRQLTTDETTVLCFCDHSSGALGHFAVQLPEISTVPVGTKFLIRNQSLYQNTYVYLHTSDSNQKFMKAWSASKQEETSPFQLATSWRTLVLYAYEDKDDVLRWMIALFKN